MPPIDDDDLDNEDRGDEFVPTDEPEDVGVEKELELDDEVELPKTKVKEVADEPADEPDEEGEEEEAPAPKEHMIPKGRFDEVNAKKRAAEARVAELEAAAAARTQATEEGEADTFDFDGKEDALTAAVIDGDAALAKSLRAEIRAAERAQITREINAAAAAKAAEVVTQSTAKIDNDRAVAKASAEYPVFDPEHESYDQDLTDEAIAMARGYQSQGYTFPDALAKATVNVAKLNGIEAVGAKKTVEKTVDVDKTQAKIDAASKQPTKNKGGSVKEVPLDPMEMSDAEWDALPPATKKRLRGDM